MQVEVTIPENLSEITLGQYQRYIKIQSELLEGGELDQKKEEFLMLKLIEIFCNVRGDDVLKMRPSDIISINNILTDMLNLNPNLVMRFKMKGKEYGFIPNLEDMTFGEYVDLDSNISDFQEIHKAMAVLYRPIEKKFKGQYTIKPYEAKEADFMKAMPMDVVFGSMIFFYHLGSDLSKVMMDYLQQEENRELHTQLLELSAKNGVGISQFLNSLKEMLHSSKISLN